MSAGEHAPAIHVCPLSQLEPVARTVVPSHLITLMTDASTVATPVPVAPDRHLRLSFNDIAAPTPGLVAPGETDIRTMLRFAGDWRQDAPLLIHCWFGISRSTAAAYVTLCALNPDRDEAEIAGSLRAAAPEATPNPRIVALGDHVLGREGRMVRAITQLGRGAFAPEGVPFSLSLSD